VRVPEGVEGDARELSIPAHIPPISRELIGGVWLRGAWFWKHPWASYEALSAQCGEQTTGAVRGLVGIEGGVVSE